MAIWLIRPLGKRFYTQCSGLPKGGIYITVPIGRENTLYFNAHRVFEIHTIPRQLTQCKLIKFAYIKDGKIIEVESEKFSSFQMNEDYLCGCYIFEKC